MGRPFHLENAGSMSAGVYGVRMAVERGRIATIRQAIKENNGAIKNKHARHKVGSGRRSVAMHSRKHGPMIILGGPSHTKCASAVVSVILTISFVVANFSSAVRAIHIYIPTANKQLR